MIDLRSDTMTLPSPEMRHQWAAAAVGDDYYGEDPSVNRLEDCCRERFGTEAAVFVASGMMGNQLAIASQVDRGAEVVTEYGYHINLFESAQYASLCQVVLNAWHTADGVLTADHVEQAIASKPRESPYAPVALVSVENAINSRQGRVFPFRVIQDLRRLTQARGIRFHMDGARIFNAHVATGIPLADYAAQVDTLMASFSKGLGAPFGSIVVGPREVIARIRHLRVRYGGGLHQAGALAQAAMFALTRQLGAIADDHRRARLMAEALARRVDLGVRPDQVETNVVMLDLSGKPWSPDAFERLCHERGVRVLTFPPHRVRLMFSRLVTDAQTLEAAEIVADVADALDGRKEPQHV